MVPPVMSAPLMPLPLSARNAGDALAWDLRGMRSVACATDLLWEVASKLPFFVPRTGLLLLDWQCRDNGDGVINVQPRLDMHSEPWLSLPVAAVRPTGATLHVDRRDGERTGERQLTLQMPVRGGRRGPRVPLATGLMRMSMQAHDQHVRFLPVVTRGDLGEDRHGAVSLHLHSIDLATLVAKGSLDPVLRKRLAGCIAGQVLALMSLPGAGLARNAPMIIDPNDF